MILEFIKLNKKKLLIVLIIVIVLSIFSFFINKNEKNKIYMSDSYVYTKDSFEHEEGFVSNLPSINVKGDNISNINSELISRYYEIIAIDDMFMDYKYYKNDNLLSLIVNIYYKSSPNAYPYDVLIYNVDIDTGNVLSDEELFNIFNVDSDEISDTIYEELREYYNYEKKNGYFISECDFDCYLENLNAMPILENCKYFVKDNNLIAYKVVQLGNEFFYDVNSGFDLFKFKIKSR